MNTPDDYKNAKGKNWEQEIELQIKAKLQLLWRPIGTAMMRDGAHWTLREWFADGSSRLLAYGLLN